jgi:hypothetical protein
MWDCPETNSHDRLQLAATYSSHNNTSTFILRINHIPKNPPNLEEKNASKGLTQETKFITKFEIWSLCTGHHAQHQNGHETSHRIPHRHRTGFPPTQNLLQKLKPQTERFKIASSDWSAEETPQEKHNRIHTHKFEENYQTPKPPSPKLGNSLIHDHNRCRKNHKIRKKEPRNSAKSTTWQRLRFPKTLRNADPVGGQEQAVKESERCVLLNTYRIGEGEKRLVRKMFTRRTTISGEG